MQPWLWHYFSSWWLKL